MDSIMMILVVVVFGLFCGIYLWVYNKDSNETSENASEREEEEITITRTRIVGSKSQKSTASVVIGIIVGAIIGFYAGSFLFSGLFVSQISVLIGGIAGAITAKSKEYTTFQVVYSDESQEIVTVSNKSSKFEDLCQYLEK